MGHLVYQTVADGCLSGVSAFRAMMNKHRDSNLPKLNVLLCETLVAVYVSWLCYALALYDANMLYRLVGHSFHESVWALLFGGCCKKQVVVTTPNPSDQQGSLFFHDIAAICMLRLLLNYTVSQKTILL